MKLITATIAAAVLGTSAFADQSDRYNDLRLDTSEYAPAYADAAQAKADPGKSTRYNDLRLDTTLGDSNPAASMSTRSATATLGYAYESPYGVGPANDSR